jgi:hypothetical protein
VALLGVRRVVRDFNVERGISATHRIVEMELAQSAPAQFHQRLVHCDAREPRIEAGVSTKCVHVPERTDEGILKNFLGVLVVPRNFLRKPENPRAVCCHELCESIRIASPDGVHERHFFCSRPLTEWTLCPFVFIDPVWQSWWHSFDPFHP